MSVMDISGVLFLLVIGLSVFTVIRGESVMHFTLPLLFVAIAALGYLQIYHRDRTPVRTSAAVAAVPRVSVICPPAVLNDQAVVARMHQLHVPKADALHAARALVMRCPQSARMWFTLAKVRLAYGLSKQSRVALAMAYRLDPSGSFASKGELERVSAGVAGAPL